MRIGVIGPSENEINPFIDSMHELKTEKYAMLNFHTGKYSNIDAAALFCGVCKVNAAIAAQILIDKFAVTHIIVTGVAGAIDKNLKVFDTVISSEVAYHDVEEGILINYHPWMESVYFKADNNMLKDIIRAVNQNKNVLIGRMVTGEGFIVQDGRNEIIEKYNPLCVDMETAGIAHVCYANSIPFIAIRTISDTPEESGSDAFEKNCETAARKSINVLKCYLDNLKENKNI